MDLSYKSTIARKGTMTEQERVWLDAALRYGGDFIKSFAMACFRADLSNFAILRPALAAMMEKYPKYSEGRP